MSSWSTEILVGRGLVRAQRLDLRLELAHPVAERGDLFLGGLRRRLLDPGHLLAELVEVRIGRAVLLHAEDEDDPDDPAASASTVAAPSA